MNDAELDTLAKGLTEAQEVALWYYPLGYHAPSVIRALLRKGLLGNGKVTPLGLALRVHLEGQSDA